MTQQRYRNMPWLIPIVLCGGLFLTGCTPSVPTSSQPEARLPRIYPDYVQVTLPINIAPMNFIVQEEGDDFITEFSSDTGTPIVARGKTVDIDLQAWKALLSQNTGKTLTIQQYVQVAGQWKKFEPIQNTISGDPIDSWVSYRLIEPGYEFFDRISLNQRNLENFDAEAFFQNDLIRRGMCVNCHSYQNRHTQNFLFHMRAYLGGTMIVRDGKPEKRNIKMDELISAGVYPAWHPTLPLIAFSVNDTFQAFHTLNPNRIEVLDSSSDLVLYDPDKNEMTSIFKTTDKLETFPNWSQDGRWLYYCCSDAPNVTVSNAPTPAASEVLGNPTNSGNPMTRASELSTEQTTVSAGDTMSEAEDSHMGGKSAQGKLRSQTSDHYTEFHYNIMRMPFDLEKRQFGAPEMVVDAASQQQSVVHPRLSPDGRYLLYTQSNYGQFPIWHRESDLKMLDLETGTVSNMEIVNSPETESYHTWSSNGRWFVFSSRRDDSLFTRLYFAHFAEDGTLSKPFLLPQRDPQQNLELFKSYNIPELTVEPISLDIRELVKAARVAEPPKATYQPVPLRPATVSDPTAASSLPHPAAENQSIGGTAAENAVTGNQQEKDSATIPPSEVTPPATDAMSLPTDLPTDITDTPKGTSSIPPEKSSTTITPSTDSLEPIPESPHE